ncbi:MAG: hypothetical protein IJH39_05775 [Clostridia bacterium]|nr:hypothetical protein [Clostridia bacterium]
METINTTPARHNNTIIEKTFNELKQVLENAKENESGYNGLPGILNLMKKVGIDKIFFVGRDYHGKYEDDYCYFTYWNEAEKKFEKDEWGTWAAFPHYDLYEMPLDFGVAWENGLIDKEAYLAYQQSSALQILSNTKFDKNVAKDYKLRVSINGGRKFKGEGYLVDVEESSYRYATPMFRNHSDNFGISITETAVIWNPIDNTLNRANLKYVNYMDSEEIMEKYTFWAKKVIMDSTVNDIKSNNQYNLGSYILNIDYSFAKFMGEVWAPEHQIGDVISTAYDPEAEARKKKESEFRTSKMPGIIEWVKNNTDKQGEEIIKLAIHIYNKNYGN